MNHGYLIALTGFAASLLSFSCVTTLADDGDQQAQWIWGSESANESTIDGLCLFQKEFELDGAPAKAIFRITCDDQYVVRINNRLIGVNESWQDIERYDVTSVLKQGTNTVFVRARNLSQGPAGLLANFEFTFDDKTKKSIVTDASWNASIQKSGTWNPDIAKIKKWKKAISFGDEASTTPWMGSLKEADQIKVVGASHRLSDKFELENGDRVLFLGNTVIEREQRYGYWEAALTTHYPNKNIIFRNLGWSGDTVLGEARARFGSQQEGFDHLEVHVHAVSPTVIICGYGSNAAFAGEEHLDRFVSDYENLLDALEATGSAIVLMAPLKHEPVNGKFLSPEYNSNRDLYAAAIKKLAERRDCLYFEVPQDEREQPLSDNGVHLTEQGYAKTAADFAGALGLSSSEQATIEIDAATKNATSKHVSVTDLVINNKTISFTATPERIDATAGTQLIVKGLKANENRSLSSGVVLDKQQRELIDAIREKNELYFHRWRPQNATYLFLFRKHEQGNNAVEIPMFDPLVEELEKKIAELRKPKPVKYVFNRKQETSQ